MKFVPIEKLIALYGKLSKREKIIFYATTAMIVLTFSDRLVIGPIAGMFYSLDREVVDVQTQIDRTMRVLSQKKQIESEIEKYTGYSI